jgi:3-hydroxyisobutyrate dehydrogenase-like beta-hydroxyacid dehydrogenase
MRQEKIGFIGVGNIGQPMAETLIRKGFEVWVHDLREEPVAQLERLGAKRAKSPKELGSLCNPIIVMVRNTAQAEAVILGKDGIMEGAKQGTLILLMCTVEPSFCRQVAKVVAEKKVGLLDATVSGGSGGAKAGTLTIMVGGEEKLLKKCRHVLEAMGKNIFYVGGIGTGQIVKLANNLANFANQVGAAEAVALATKAGIKLERLVEIISVSTGDSWAIRNWPSYRDMKIREGEHIEVKYKTMRVQKAVAKELGLHLPLLEFMYQLDFLEMFKGTAFQPKKASSAKKEEKAGKSKQRR